jgi:hypothetical protein
LTEIGANAVWKGNLPVGRRSADFYDPYDLRGFYIIKVLSDLFDIYQKSEIQKRGHLIKTKTMKNHLTGSSKIKLLLLLIITGCAIVCFLPRIAQSTAYHLFADRRELIAIPNCLNVLSNLPFLLIGIAGMYHSAFYIRSKLQPHFFIFFTGILLTGIGSSYYHLSPDNATLVWDRLPMTISFMSFFSIIIADYISPLYTRWLLSILLLAGAGSVLYWNYTEAAGLGDLRFYIGVQFLPMLIIPLILLLFKPGNLITKDLWFVLLAYAMAKLAESADQPVFDSLKFISGHSIKHLLAALAPLIILLSLNRTKPAGT